MKNNIFINKYVMACAISIVIALVGYISMSTLAVEQYPDIAPPTVSVSTSYTGADENTVMKSVIQPLEEAINGVSDMTYMTSKASSNGDVEISVYFKQGVDPDMAAVNVQNRVTRAQALLPADVNKIGVSVQKRQNNILQIFAVKSSDGKYDEDFVSNYVDINVKPRLMRITGVGNVLSLGNTSAMGSLGEQSENSYQYSMQYKGTLKSVEEFNDIVLRTSGGGMLHLSDVAEVKIGAMSYNFTSNIQDRPGAMFMVFQAPGANATEVNARINKTFEELKANMPAGLEFVTLMTSDDFLFAAIHNVVETLIIAIILVVLSSPSSSWCLWCSSSCRTSRPPSSPLSRLSFHYWAPLPSSRWQVSRSTS